MENSDDKGWGQYIQSVRDNTRRYVENLLEENSKLQLRISTLEDARTGLERRLVATQVMLDRQGIEEEDLKRRFDTMESEQRRFFEEYVKVEAQNNNLASLYVATYGLHGALEQSQVLATIQEIVANLIGCEEIAIFEREAGSGELGLLASHGVDSEQFCNLRLGAGVIGQVANSGDSFVASEHELDGALPQEANLTACVPLMIGERITGALALFRLLHQKPGLDPLDLELFDLLARQAGTALYSAKLHEQIESARTSA